MIYENLEPYPNSNKWKRFLDKAVYYVAIIGPIMTIPQILMIWVEKNASGVSVVSWVSYMFIAIFWLLYGIVHNEKPIIFANCFWLVSSAIVVAGTLIYG